MTLRLDAVTANPQLHARYKEEHAEPVSLLLFFHASAPQSMRQDAKTLI